AEHTVLEVEVAVKFLAPWQFRRDPKALERFRRAAAATARINSPHVLRVFDYGVLEDNTAYIVMELLEGETLGERLQR
ncbi:serine/threonine protein kinase, partial [Escherichia coli]|nr:serine/threonine protein kinase [Escherichia coli]